QGTSKQTANRLPQPVISSFRTASSLFSSSFSWNKMECRFRQRHFSWLPALWPPTDTSTCSPQFCAPRLVRWRQIQSGSTPDIAPKLVFFDYSPVGMESNRQSLKERSET